MLGRAVTGGPQRGWLLGPGQLKTLSTSASTHTHLLANMPARAYTHIQHTMGKSAILGRSCWFSGCALWVCREQSQLFPAFSRISSPVAQLLESRSPCSALLF